MRKPTSRIEALASRVHDVLVRYTTRLLLTGLILLSICPFDFVDEYWWAFVAIFGMEVVARVLILTCLPAEGDDRRRPVIEVGMLLLDVLAIVSFLPFLQEKVGWGHFLRLARAARLLLLLGYWGGTIRLLWLLTIRRERALQLWILVVSVSVLSVISAAFMGYLDPSYDDLGLQPEEFQENGDPVELEFHDYLWWSFRQVQDPGNLVADLGHLGIWLLSVFLTIGGLFIFSFLIGIGTTVVAELVHSTREQPLGLRNHSILVNANERSHFFLDQIVDHYRKQLKRPRWMALGSESAESAFEANYRGINFRMGTPYQHGDLEKIDAGRAKRFVVLANPTAEAPDAQTISAVLSCRRVNTEAQIFAEVHDEKHAAAILAAGGNRTVVVATEHLLALTLANVVLNPSSYEVLEELLTARGQEIYTYLYLPEDGELSVGNLETDFEDMLRYAYEEHRCTVLGLSMLQGPTERSRYIERRFVLNPVQAVEADSLRGSVLGVAGIAQNFKRLRSLARDLTEGKHRGAWSQRSESPQAPIPALVPAEVVEDESILVCGVTPRTPLLLEHLLQLQPRLRVFLMVREESSDEARDLLEAAGRSVIRFGEHDLYNPGPRGTFEEEAPGVFAYHPAGEESHGGRIRLLEGDWASRDVLLDTTEGGYRLEDVRKIVLQSGSHDEHDPDAQTVMTVMKLRNLHLSPGFRERLHPSLEIVAELVDHRKAALIEERFAGEGAAIPITVVPSERIRNVLLFHSTVVPGFGSIFMELFNRHRQHFYELRFAPGTRLEGKVTYAELLLATYRQHGALLLGLVQASADEEDGTLVVLEAEEHDVELADVRALFVIGPAPGTRSA